MKFISLIFALALSFSTSAVIADGGGSGGGSGAKDPKPVPAKVIRLVESEQFDRALVELKAFVKEEKKNADAWNWLGYSQRSTGDLDGSLKSYEKALRLDKKHLGANEYLGELYVMRGNMKKANKQLKRLAKYCGDCDEYQKLKGVIENAQG